MAAIDAPFGSIKNAFKEHSDSKLEDATVNGRRNSVTAWGARGRQFKSARPDQLPSQYSSYNICNAFGQLPTRCTHGWDLAGCGKTAGGLANGWTGRRYVSAHAYNCWNPETSLRG
jgi:hypothetical protein